MCNVLLIGNGPAALSKEIGQAIDNFDGLVVRFNNYKTEGYEKYVGTRTDIWVTCERNVEQMKNTHKERYFISWRQDEPTAKTVRDTKAERIPRSVMMQSIDTMGFHVPSSGVIATEFFLSKGYDVWIWGFDFLCQRRNHHYNKDGQVRGEGHDEWKEWEYFHKLEQQGRIWWFGLGKYESIPIYRQPVPCGSDNDIASYREAAHQAWYSRFGKIIGKHTVLDVGAGLCEGMKILERHGCKVMGQDIDKRLRGVHPNIKIGSLAMFANKSVAYITCVDVIEHCVEDLKLISNMRRIARSGIFITTPCYTRSRCGNPAHCREYSIPQFANIFRPSEVWSASPDGAIHYTKLLTKAGNNYIDHSPEGPDNLIQDVPVIRHIDQVPVTTKFNTTVDGEEWAHICGKFYEDSL